MKHGHAGGAGKAQGQNANVGARRLKEVEGVALGARRFPGSEKPSARSVARFAAPQPFCDVSCG